MSDNNRDYDEIRQNLLESSVLMKKLHISQAKTDEQIQELKISQAKTDEQLAKTDEQLAKTDKQIQELKISQAKTDEQLKETAEQVKKTAKRVEETTEQVNKTEKTLKNIGLHLGGLGNHIGDFSEEFFFRSLEENSTLGDMKFDRVERWIRKTKKSKEIDILLINGACVALIEVKFKADYNQLGEIKAQKTRSFRDNHYIYRNHDLYFGIASMSTEPELIDAAREAKIYLLTQKGEHLVVANDQVQLV